MDIFEQLYFTKEQIFFIDFLIKIYFLLDYYTHVFLSFFFFFNIHLFLDVDPHFYLEKQNQFSDDSISLHRGWLLNCVAKRILMTSKREKKQKLFPFWNPNSFNLLNSINGSKDIVFHWFVICQTGVVNHLRFWWILAIPITNSKLFSTTKTRKQKRCMTSVS